jgi:hypothetical protein
VLVGHDLNNPDFQENLLTLQKTARHAALDTFKKLRQMTWNQIYRDSSLKWNKIVSVNLPTGIDAIYSLRITQARSATDYRDGEFIRVLTIASDHNSKLRQSRTNVSFLGCLCGSEYGCNSLINCSRPNSTYPFS